jgi:regulator of protease activity HflC (stomatin/prohibitin superfamily)
MASVITREIAEKVRDTVDAGLMHGVGKPIPGQMCVEAAVCFALGLPHGDDPACVAPSLRRLKIGLNDRNWSSPQVRAKGLRRLAVAQLGSAGALDETVFRARIVEMTIRRAVPVALRAAAMMNPTHAEALEAAAVRCEREGTREAARDGERVARAAAYAAYADAYAAAADAAAAAAAAADAATPPTPTPPPTPPTPPPPTPPTPTPPPPTPPTPPTPPLARGIACSRTTRNGSWKS